MAVWTTLDFFLNMMNQPLIFQWFSQEV